MATNIDMRAWVCYDSPIKGVSVVNVVEGAADPVSYSEDEVYQILGVEK